jgi:DNA-binding CsgD family transcriptional regulator
MLNDVFFELAEEMEHISQSPDGHDFLKTCVAKYDLTNAAYLGINLPAKREEDRCFVASTYSESWRAQYMSQNYLSIDPVVKRGLHAIIPLDWANIDTSERKVHRMFGEASEHGVGQHGMSFPIRGARGELALFSINSAGSKKDWNEKKRVYMRDFQIIAFHFHQHVVDIEMGAAPDDPIHLTGREIEVLKWAAEGKSEWETAQILEIGHNTVRFHLENARVRLKSTNKTQAAVKAVRLHLI